MENRFWFGDTPKEGILTFPFHDFSKEKLKPKTSYKSLYWGMVFALSLFLFLFFSLFQNVQPAQTQAEDFANYARTKNFDKAYSFLSPQLKQSVSDIEMRNGFQRLNLDPTSNISFFHSHTDGTTINLIGTLEQGEQSQPVSFIFSRYEGKWLIDEILIGQGPFANQPLPELFFSAN